VPERVGLRLAGRWALMLVAAALAFALMTIVLRWLSPPGHPVSWLDTPQSLSRWLPKYPQADACHHALSAVKGPLS